MQTPPSPIKPRMGCFTRLLLIFLLGVALVLAIDAVFAPWSFFMGGKFHPIPMWKGWGRIHSAVGDYVLFVQMQPRTGRRGIAHVAGTAALCTPRGETFDLTLGGDFEKYMGASTDGKHVYLYLHKRGGFFSGTVSDTRPGLEFRGAWHNPDIVLDDHGSLSRAFKPDGVLYDLHKQPATHEILPLTLHEGSRSEFDSACQAVKAR
ncbi:MAG TPA: hypothetical protein VKY85_25345 [Candidatus Angelobacter sp.]|nr:hypothetical protein [Candidatus Angelobacter sp.]